MYDENTDVVGSLVIMVIKNCYKWKENSQSKREGFNTCGIRFGYEKPDGSIWFLPMGLLNDPPAHVIRSVLSPQGQVGLHMVAEDTLQTGLNPVTETLFTEDGAVNPERILTKTVLYTEAGNNRSQVVH